MHMQTAPLVLHPSRKTTPGFKPGTSISTGRRATTELYPRRSGGPMSNKWILTLSRR